MKKRIAMMMAATLLIGCTSCEAKNHLAAGDSLCKRTGAAPSLS